MTDLFLITFGVFSLIKWSMYSPDLDKIFGWKILVLLGQIFEVDESSFAWVRCGWRHQ